MNRLLQLLRDNRKPGAPVLALKADTSDTEATVYLYDMIDDYFGISAQSFCASLNAITAPTINLRINSPGGDVFAARAMATAIKEHPSNIVAHVDGVAASAASYIATACDSCVIAEGAFFMIHKAWTIAFGNADDLVQTADLLEKIDATIVADYAKKTGKSADELMALMAAETWLEGQEAVDAGFADSMAEQTDTVKAQAWNLAAYSAAPEALKKAVEQTETKDEACALLRANAARKLQLFERTAA